MAPEYLLRGEISTKSDIYSLGILILEVVTGKRNHQAMRNKSGEHFIEDVRRRANLKYFFSYNFNFYYYCDNRFQHCRYGRIGLTCPK